MSGQIYYHIYLFFDHVVLDLNQTILFLVDNHREVYLSCC